MAQGLSVISETRPNAEFALRKGYVLPVLLPALWHDLGTITAKVRIDYSDVVTTLLEESYFIPVFRWHEARGMLFGHDNCGRGCIEKGHAAYGDPFRTMRWYSAPGTDDPKLDGPRAFRGLKVNSSIAHLYERPRVWCECFHSSGWGASPAAIIAALHADFIFGATVVNLHGLYYSTHGGWWEWAPPDFHFRQPYWQHQGAFSDYVARLCETLSQGHHACDVALFYPITSVEAGLNARVAPAGDASPYSETQAGHGGAPVDEAEAHAFGLGHHLVRNGIDFDFLDFDSLDRAELRDGALLVAGECYRVLILPLMRAIRFRSLEKARDFMRAGGVVLAYGCLPEASDRQGRHDPALDALVKELFAGSEGGERARLITGDYSRVSNAITQLIARDFQALEAPFQVLHRRTDTQDIYFIFNPERTVRFSRVRFRATGAVEQWNAWSGERHPLVPLSAGEADTSLDLRLDAEAATLIVFTREPARCDAAAAVATLRPAAMQGTASTLLRLGRNWDFELLPTLDNRFGDFQLPASANRLGAEARSFRHAVETAASTNAWRQARFDDSAWEKTTSSFGPRFWRLGPIAPGADLPALAATLAQLTAIDPCQPVLVQGRSYSWTPHTISLRWGVENDPFLRDWASGPHGLKGEVPDEFLDLDCPTPGALWFLWTSVHPENAGLFPFVMGGRASHAAWLNGAPVLPLSEGLAPGLQSQWNLPHYRSTPRQIEVELQAGENPLLLGFVQPAGQRLRAYAAFRPADFARDDPPSVLGLRWFRRPGHPLLNANPATSETPAAARAGWYRFMSPPGLASLALVARGLAQVWVDGEECTVCRRSTPDGLIAHTARVTRHAPGSVQVAVRVELPPGSVAGDALPEPIALHCTAGVIELGDWCRHGLETYSGAARYGQILELSAEQLAQLRGHGAVLDLGQVAVTAAVEVNGHPLATLLAPPWRVAVAEHLVAGKNRIEVVVANTLANHYSVGIPSPYALPSQTVSGLIGPVVLHSA